MADILMLVMIAVIGFSAGFLTSCALFDTFRKNTKINSDSEPMDIGTLYVYEGRDRDRYSFAFNCPLDQVGELKKVTLDIKKHREKSLQEIEDDVFARDFDSNMDNI